MDDGFVLLGALFQVSVALSQQCQHSNLGLKVPGALWDIGAASMAQLDSEALVRSLLGCDTHLDEEPPHLNPCCRSAGPLLLTITQFSCSALW